MKRTLRWLAGIFDVIGECAVQLVQDDLGNTDA